MDEQRIKELADTACGPEIARREYVEEAIRATLANQREAIAAMLDERAKLFPPGVMQSWRETLEDAARAVREMKP